MRYSKCAIPAVAVMALLAGCADNAPDEGATYRLYFLSGQSNMDGYGFVSDLPAGRAGTVPGVRIFTGKTAGDNEPGGGRGIWDALGPGYGTGFDTDGRANRLSDRFGPELAFGQRLVEIDPDSKIAIVKFSRGGSALYPGGSGYGTWNPDFDEGAGLNQYDNALNAIREASSHRDIDGDGAADVLIPSGIVWMQGEADAYHSQEAAEAYEANLDHMMALLRAALRVDDLPVVIGKITDSGMADDGKVMDYIDIVQQAQRDFVNGDACAALVTVTDDADYLDDGWHYVSEAYLELGAAFADAAVELESRCAPAGQAL